MALPWLKRLFTPPSPAARGPAPSAPLFPSPEDQKLETAAGNFLTGGDEGQLQEEVLSRLPENEQIARTGRWVEMASSNVKAIRYLWDDQILEVQFKNNSFYEYFQVPEAVFYAFLDYPSPGRFVWRFLRDVYEYVRLDVSHPKKTRSGPRNRAVVRPRRDLESGVQKVRGIIPGHAWTVPAVHPETGRWSVKDLR